MNSINQSVIDRDSLAIVQKYVKMMETYDDLVLTHIWKPKYNNVIKELNYFTSEVRRYSEENSSSNIMSETLSQDILKAIEFDKELEFEMEWDEANADYDSSDFYMDRRSDDFLGWDFGATVDI